MPKKKQLHRIQVTQNGLLKILLGLNRRTGTNDLHTRLRLLKVEDVYNLHLIVFINKCVRGNSIPYFNSYFQIRENPYSLRDRRLATDFARTQIGYLTVKNIAVRKWDEISPELKAAGNQLNFRKLIASHFISRYNIQHSYNTSN